MEVGVNARWPVPDTVTSLDTARGCSGRQHRSSRHMAAIQSVHAKRNELPSRHLPSRTQTEHASLYSRVWKILLQVLSMANHNQTQVDSERSSFDRG